jgi:sialic acid synthase SpsE
VSARSYGKPVIEVGGRPIGPGHPCYVIAEAGANHNRDLGIAKQLIDVAAEAGADAVKFQTYTAEGLYSRKTPNPSYLKKKDLLKSDTETVWELIKRVEIPWEWHDELASHSKAAGIDFLSTPFEEAAVDLLETVGMPAYKVASYEITHLPLIEYIARTGKPRRATRRRSTSSICGRSRRSRRRSRFLSGTPTTRPASRPTWSRSRSAPA